MPTGPLPRAELSIEPSDPDGLARMRQMSRTQLPGVNVLSFIDSSYGDQPVLPGKSLDRNILVLNFLRKCDALITRLACGQSGDSARDADATREC